MSGDRARGSLLVLCVLAASAVLAQDALSSLQGRWVVTHAESLGKPLDAIRGGVLTVTGSDFVIRTAAGRLLTGTLRADGTRSPAHLDLLHADGRVWEAIYALEAGQLGLVYVPQGTEARPSAFTTGTDSYRTLVVLEREAPR